MVGYGQGPPWGGRQKMSIDKGEEPVVWGYHWPGDDDEEIIRRSKERRTRELEEKHEVWNEDYDYNFPNDKEKPVLDPWE